MKRGKWTDGWVKKMGREAEGRRDGWGRDEFM